MTDPGTESIAFELAMEGMRRVRPSYFYEPKSVMQERLHVAPQRLCAMFVGNRSGKSTGMAYEVQRAMDKPKSIAVWVCPQFKQFDALRADFEALIFDKDAVYVTDDFYRWPNGSKCFIIPRERDWQFIQGINPDLVCVDEECPVSLWRELRARGAGFRKTRYIIGATATSGDITWMATDIYHEWLKYHADKGLDERQAMESQLHPEIWCWPVGGIDDNAAMTDDAKRYFKSLKWSGDKEKRVRERGGFIQWVGDAVFQLEDLDWLRDRRAALFATMGGGREGALIVDARPVQPLPEKAYTPPWVIVP